MLADDRVSDAEVISVMKQVPKILGELNDKIAAECARIGSNHKAAYKVLLEIKPVAEFDKALDEKAAMQAQVLITAAKTWITRNDGAELKKMADLAAYLETGQKGLSDPWGFPF